MIQKEWSAKYKESEAQKERHMNNLRPNLSHPENAGELEELVKSEDSRKVDIIERVGSYKESMIDVYFKECNAFFVSLINNLNFVMLYYDKWVLNEDYIKLPGDENVERRHMNLRKLMIKKEKGDLADTNSERSIKKAWKGFPILSFSYGDKIAEIKVEEVVDDKKKPGKAADKKAAAGKGAKGGVEVDEVTATKQDDNCTANIVSYKTDRQKNAYSTMTKIYDKMKNGFDTGIEKIEEVHKEVTTKETYFEFYFENTRNKLFVYN